MKICTKCKRELDESCFSKRGDTKDGLSYICKECKHKYDQKFDEKKKQEVKENNVGDFCVKCGKKISYEQKIDGIWYVSKFCKECFPNQIFKDRICKKCGKVFKTGRKPSKLNDNIIRDYCPDCSSKNQEIKELICPKCGKIYYTTRTSDGRHFKHKRVCNDCSKPKLEKECTCEKCGKKIIITKESKDEHFRNVRFCSSFCASTQTEFKNGKVQLKQKYSTCKYCGKIIELEFKDHGWRPRTVCDDCLKPKEKPKYIERTCSICGKTFKAELQPCGNYSSSQYCSDECASIGFNTKCKETCQEKYGVDYPCQTEQALQKGNVISEINKKFAILLEENNLSYEMEFVLESFSYDFKIGNILIEINPTYTHNAIGNYFGKAKEKGYHYSKSKVAIKHGYICICVWDWDNWNAIINLIKQPNLKMEYVGIKLVYSKGKEKINSEDITNINEIVNQGYLPVYTDGYKVIPLNMIYSTRK